MKFIHTADWHLGKTVNGASMLDDQQFALDQLIALIDKEQPDALVIAGDLYDRSVPPAAAVTLLNDVLFRINVEMGVPVVAISGNHDSAERLSFGSAWFQKNKFYMAGTLTETTAAPVIDGVAFHCFPYVEPSVARSFYDDATIRTHHDAAKRMIDGCLAEWDEDIIHIAVGHAFVAGGEPSDSERLLSVGGTSHVGAELFEPFHYTALGHLHNPSAIRHPSIAYAGSLLKYSFSEAAHEKSVAVVEVSGSTVTVRKEPIRPARDMRIVTGFFDELMASDPSDDYVKVVLKDTGAIMDPMNKLRRTFPNVLHLEKEVTARTAVLSPARAAREKTADIDLFESFYTAVTGFDWTEEKKKFVEAAMEETRKRGDVK